MHPTLPDENYFALFGLPVSFNTDENALKKAFYKTSRAYHPDFHTELSEEEQGRIAVMSEYVNQAYTTLADSNTRLKYILNLYGFASEQTRHQLPADFLMEMLTLNEDLEELGNNRESDAWKKCLSTLEEFEKQINMEIAAHISLFEDSEDRAAVLRDLEMLYFKNKYLLRIRENLSTFASPY